MFRLIANKRWLQLVSLFLFACKNMHWFYSYFRRIYKFLLKLFLHFKLSTQNRYKRIRKELANRSFIIHERRCNAKQDAIYSPAHLKAEHTRSHFDTVRGIYVTVLINRVELIHTGHDLRKSNVSSVFANGAHDLAITNSVTL